VSINSWAWAVLLTAHRRCTSGFGGCATRDCWGRPGTALLGLFQLQTSGIPAVLVSRASRTDAHGVVVLAVTLGLGLSCWLDVAGASVGVVGVLPETAGEGPALLCLGPVPCAAFSSVFSASAFSASASGSAAALASSAAVVSCRPQDVKNWCERRNNTESQPQSGLKGPAPSATLFSA